MSKPELKRFIELTKAKSSEVNNNFDLLNNYVESVSVSSLTGYDPTTTYPKGAWIIGGIDNKKTIYESLVDDNKGNALDDERYWKKITLGGGLPVGTIFPSTAALDFVPENSLPCDGMEYTKTQFPNLYTDWLVGKKLATCTYEEYQQEITDTGECLKFGIDTAQGKFKVPTKLNKYVSPNGGGKAPVTGNGMTLGLTDGINNGSLFNPEAGYGGYTGNTQNSYGKPVGTRTEWKPYLKEGGSIGVTTDPTKSGIEADLSNAIKTKEIRYFVVVATGSIKQSEMDWSKWASSLEGKANVDLGNTTIKLNNSFLEKLMPDYSAGIDVFAQFQQGRFTPVANGIVKIFLGGDSAIRVATTEAGIENYKSSENIALLNEDTGVYNTCYVFVCKGIEYFTFTSMGSSDVSVIFYPLKGAN